MTNTELIRQEIERRLLGDYNSGDTEIDEVAQGVCAALLYFIDSLPKESEKGMKWRTDKPTADVIVAKIDGHYLALRKYANNYYTDDTARNFIPYYKLVKWADLEEDETVTDTERIRKEGSLEYWLEYFGMPKENIENCITQIAQGYGACRYLEGVQHGTEAVNELAKETPTPEQAMKSLDEKIKSAKKSWEGVDVDKYMDEVRGRDETVTDCDELEDAASVFANTYVGDNDTTDIYNFVQRTFCCGAKWGAEYRDRFLNWIRDLIKAGIEKPEEALNILKRIDTLINDNSLWAEHLKK